MSRSPRTAAWQLRRRPWFQGSFSFAVFLFGGAEWREMFLLRGNSQFRETSLGAYYLAAPAQAAAAADGINIDAQFPGCFQQGSAQVKNTPSPRGREYNFSRIDWFFHCVRR